MERRRVSRLYFGMPTCHSNGGFGAPPSPLLRASAIAVPSLHEAWSRGWCLPLPRKMWTLWLLSQGCRVHAAETTMRKLFRLPRCDIQSLPPFRKKLKLRQRISLDNSTHKEAAEQMWKATHSSEVSVYVEKVRGADAFVAARCPACFRCCEIRVRNKRSLQIRRV